MHDRPRCRAAMAAAAMLLLPVAALAQGTRADYERASGLRAKWEALAVGMAEPATFVENTNLFWYRKSVKGGQEFVMVDAETQERKSAFDHERLATSLSAATGGKYTAHTLPTTNFAFVDRAAAIEVVIDGGRWRCQLSDYGCKKPEPARGGFGSPPFACAPPSPDDRPQPSPDGKWEALVDNYNLAIREAGARKLTHLSTDGSEGNCYQPSSIRWSPDSKTIAVYRVRPG